MMNWHGLLDETAFAALLPEANAHFAKPVCDGLAVFLQGLPESHQSAIFSQQATLDPSAPLAARLGLLARSSPVLQKIGQILARDQRFSLDLRQHLQQLESLPPTIRWETIQAILDQQLGSLDRLGITLAPPALAEASVAVVVPFRKNVSGVDQHGVFKILKPGIEEQLNLELALLEQVGSHLDERCEELQIPHLDYQEAFRQVREKLQDEIHLDGEQQKITAARKFYATESRVQIPELFDCCTPRVTAMQRIWGSKVTDHQLTRARDRRRLAELIIDAMIAQPVFSEQNRSFFHSDPHAGNLFHTADGRLAILDWSLVGWLDQPERISIVQVMLGAVTHDPQRIITALSGIAENNSLDQPKLQSVVSRWLREMRRGQFPGLFWMVGMLDEAVRDARLRLKPDLMMFRKSLYTLEGVVAEVGATTYTFDKVLCVNLLRHLTMEWPSRWFKSPNSHEFATRLSNFDLIRAILGCPSAIARFGMGQGFDLMETCRTSS